METATDAWIEGLAKKVANLLGDTKEKVRKGLDTSRYMSALTKAAKEQEIDLNDDARRNFAIRATKQRIKKLIRTKKWQEEQKGKELPSFIAMKKGSKRYIDHTLPPGDRE